MAAANKRQHDTGDVIVLGSRSDRSGDGMMMMGSDRAWNPAWNSRLIVTVFVRVDRQLFSARVDRAIPCEPPAEQYEKWDYSTRLHVCNELR